MDLKIETRIEAVIFNEDGNLLLVEHQKNNKSYWVLPGGHLKPLEKVEKCILRELTEELSLENVKVGDLCFVDEYINKSKKRHIIKIGFICNASKEVLGKIRINENEEVVKNFGFFSSTRIFLSIGKFYPSKTFFITLIKNYQKEAKS
ncbi:MAG: NUDIX domain-containing protein [Brevinematia bacterium]